MTHASSMSGPEKRPNRTWIWILVGLPIAGFLSIAGVLALLALMTMGIEKSPGYALATSTVSKHPGVVSLLGAPVRVTRTKSKHIHKSPSGTTLSLKLELEGASGEGVVEVTANEKSGRWTVDWATISCDGGRFGLLADGGLQPLYDPKAALASGP